MPKAHKPKDWLETIHHGGNSSYCSHLLCRTLSLLYLLQPASLYGGSNIEWRLGLGDESLANNADFFHCAKQASKQEQAQAVGNIVCKKSLSCLFLCCQLCVSCLWHRWQNYLWNLNWKCARRSTMQIWPSKSMYLNLTFNSSGNAEIESSTESVIATVTQAIAFPIVCTCHSQDSLRHLQQSGWWSACKA